MIGKIAQSAQPGVGFFGMLRGWNYKRKRPRLDWVTGCSSNSPPPKPVHRHPTSRSAPVEWLLRATGRHWGTSLRIRL